MPTIKRFVASLLEDVRYAARNLVRKPLATWGVVFTLTVGIGIAGSGFSILNARLLAPNVDQDPDSFFVLNVGRYRGTISLSRYFALRDQSQAVDELAAWSWLPATAPVGGDGPLRDGTFVTCNFFSVFSVTPVLGRLIHPDDCRSDDPVVVLDERLWREQFGADPDILGESLRYGRELLTVVGVTISPKPFTRTDLWLPYVLQDDLTDGVYQSSFGVEDADLLSDASVIDWLWVAGRLRDDASRSVATAEFRVIDGLNEAPITAVSGSRWSTNRIPLLWVSLYLILPAVIMVVSCINVATLLLAKSSERSREIATRLALGCDRRRLARMLMTECFVLAGVATVISLVFVYSIPRLLYPYVGPPSVPGSPTFAPTPDWNVFLFLGGSAIIATVMSGLTPALASVRTALVETLHGLQLVGGHRSASNLRRGLVALQMSVSFVPIVGVMLVLGAHQRFADPGFDAEQVMVAALTGRVQPGTTSDEITNAVMQIPGAEAVAFTQWLPLTSEGELLVIGSTVSVMSNRVSSGYFRTLGIPLLAGQAEVDANVPGDPNEAPIVVSRALAERLFPGEMPVGRRVESGAGAMLIVGVAEDRSTRSSSGVPDDSFIYRLMDPPYRGLLLVRFQGEPASVAPSLHSILQATTGSPGRVSTLEGELERVAAPLRSVGLLLAGFGAIAVTLALAGIVGVTSLATIYRRKELGIRVALGARPLDILAAIMLPELIPVLAGTAAGVLLTLFGLLFIPLEAVQLNRLAFPPYLVSALFLAGVAGIAMLIPACRVLRRDPLRSLREE